jgi:hypothetical protein
MESPQRRRQVSDDAVYRRYVLINLPHARTIVQRIERSLQNLGAFHEGDNGGAIALREAIEVLERHLSRFHDDPPFDDAINAADDAAERARALVAAILATSARGDRLGQCVRNLFECLGLADEGAELALDCGERPNSPLR